MTIQKLIRRQRDLAHRIAYSRSDQARRDRHATCTECATLCCQIYARHVVDVPLYRHVAEFYLSRAAAIAAGHVDAEEGIGVDGQTYWAGLNPSVVEETHCDDCCHDLCQQVYLAEMARHSKLTVRALAKEVFGAAYRDAMRTILITAQVLHAVKTQL